MKLRSHLILLVVTALLPLFIFACVMIVVFGRQQQRFVENSLLETARALSLAADRELLAWSNVLDTLATSEYLDSGDLKKFYNQARRVLEKRKELDTIILADPAGRQLLNTLRPFGAHLPNVQTSDQFARVIETQRPVVSDLFFGQVLGKPLVGIAVPVIRAGKVRYVLMSAVSPAFLSKLLLQQTSSGELEATIIDRNKIIIARTRNIEEFLGKPAGPVFAAKSKEREEAVWRGTMQEGPEVYSALHRSELSGWTVAVETHATIVNTPMRGNLGTAIGGGLILLLVGIVLAALFGRRIANAIGSLSNAAAALGRSEMLEITTSPVNEVNEVAQVIEDAAAKRKHAEEQLKRNLEQITALQEINRAVSSSLDLRVVLKLLLEKVDLLLPYSATSIMLANRESGELEPIACRNPDETEWKTYQKMGSGLATIVLQTRSPLAIKNLQADPRVANRDFVAQHGLVSFLGLPLIAHDIPLGFLGFNTRDEHDFSREEIEFLSALAGQLAIAIHNSQLYEQAKKMSEQLFAYHQQLRALMNSLTKTREDEARRIARELHDESGQILASAYIALDEIRREMPPRMGKKLDDVAELLDQIENQLRNISHELHPTILDDLGLLPALQFLTQRFSKRTGTQVHLEEALKQRLPLRVETTLYRIVQEALNNVTKHAHATAVHVRIQQEDGFVLCLVRDNGIGFDVPKVLAQMNGEGLGLAGIRERVEILKGSLKIQSHPGQGTEICVKLPLES